MLTGNIRHQIDTLWEKFWTGGITNPLTVIEQISYLIFARMLDMQESLAEKAATRGAKFEPIYPQTPEGQKLRWSNFRHLSGQELAVHLKQNLYPYFAEIGNKGNFGRLSDYMKNADLAIQNESVLTSAIELIEALPLNSSDVKGDIYEYLLSKLTTAGINGQFRTPRHIIDLMVEMTEPQPTETVCDPACGTAGFLARTMEYLNRTHSSEFGKFTDDDGNMIYSGDLLEEYRSHINEKMFWGFDFDSTMLRVSSMNMLLHGVSGANILYQDSLNKSILDRYPAQAENFFDVILANPPFKGSLDESNINPKVASMVKTKKTELLFTAHILNILKVGGRAAVIVPDGVLFGSSNAHQQLRKHLLENNQLEGVVSLPSGVFKPYAGVSTAILLFSKGGSSNKVWFYNVTADGYSLDDKRSPVAENDLPKALSSWKTFKALLNNNAGEDEINAVFGDKTQAGFVVDKAEITANKYDLSINRYQEVIYEQVQYTPPAEILQSLKTLEQEILCDLNELEEMLKK